MFIGRIDLLKSLTKQSNLFLPFGKVRMGYPTEEARWGLMAVSKVTYSFPWGRLGWVALWEGSDGFEGSDGLSFGGRDGL